MIRTALLALAILAAPVHAWAQCPATPQNFRVADVQRVLTFSWDPPRNCAIELYEFQAGLTQGGVELGAGAIHGSATSIALRPIPPGVYFFHLIAMSSRTFIRSAPTPDLRVIAGGGCGVPDRPRDLSGLAVDRGGNVSLEVRWSPPLGGCPPAGYIVTIAFTEAMRRTAVEFPVSAMPDPFVGLRFFLASVPTRAYSASVQSVTQEGRSEPVETELAITTPPAPGAPFNFEASVDLRGVLTLEWRLPAGGLVPVDGYVLEAGLSTGQTDETVPFLAPRGTSVMLPHLLVPRQVPIFLRLRATYRGVSSEASNQVTVFVP